MAAKVAGNVKCDQEINSRPQGQQATNNTMDNTVQEYRPTSHNTGGEGTNGPTDSQGTGVNNAMSSAGQPPGNSGTEIGTKTASSVGSVPGSNSAILQDGHHVGQSSMTSSHHPSQNQSLDPYAGPGGTFQNNSSMHNQLVDNSGQKTAQNMTGSEGFNGGYYGNRNAGFGMTNQHGGHQTGNGPPNSALNMNLGPNQNQNMANNPYNQYDGHLGSRQGYSQMVMGSRSGPNAPSMPPNYGSSHQQQPRPYGSDRISSSAPTLSQLLQGQKHVPNYSSNYPSPGDNMGKGLDGGGSLGMISNQGSGTFHQSPQNWGQRSSGMSQVHTQSASGANTYGPNMGRNQMGVAADSGVNSVPKRPFPSVPYQQQNQLSSRQYPGMAQSMYPGSHLAGSRSHNAQSQGSMGNNSTVFPQQHQPPSSSGYQQSQQPTSSYSRGGQQTTPSNNKSGSTSDEVSVANRPPSLPDLSGSLDDLPTGADFSQNNVATSSQSTDSYSQSSQSPHMHPTVSALRPSPSPVGSPASHMSRSSLSPASVPGGSLTPQPTSMPPPSSQSETSSHNQMSQSPVGQDRVFSQPMMSAASQIGTNQMPPPYGSQGTPKSHHGQQQSSHPPSAPGGSQMFPGVGVGYAGGVPVGFGPNVSQLNQQGNYQRQAGMQGLCGPPTSYPTHSTGNGGSNVFMDGRMRNTSSSSSVSSMDGFSNSQYPGYNSGNVPTNSGPGMSPSQGSTGMNSGIKSPGLGATSYGYNHPHRTTDQHSVGPASSNTSGGSSGMGSPGLGTGATGIPGASSEASIAGGSTSPGISNSTPSNLATGNKGAQAAAEAAVIAAANMASAKTAYHRTLGSQNQGRQQPQPFPPPYQQQQQQQQQPQQQLQQHWPQVPHNQGFPNSACPMPSSLPTSMPNSLTSPMPSSSVVNSMPNSIPSSMYGSAPGPLTNSLPCANIPGTLPLFSHANSQRNNSFMPTDSTGQVTATMANSLPGSVGTSVTPSITAPVCMPSVTASGLGNMLDTPKNSPAMSKEDARADTPQSQKTVKQSETASRPSSPPLGLLGASPLGSPGTISKSSQEESAPSPSPSLLNKLPASPANKPPKRSTSTKPSVHEQLMKLYDLCDHPDRKPFLDAVFRLMEDRGQPIRTMPQISTHTLDLFKLYHAVKERGGVVKVSKNKQWKQIAMYLTVGSSNSAAFTLKKNYIRYLLPFECFHDRGGVDPQVIMAEIDTSKKKSSSSSANTSSSDSSHHHTPANPVLDNIPGPGPQDFHGGPRDMYQQRPHPGGKPMNQMHPFPQPMHNNIGRGMSPMPNNMMPMSNDTTSNSVTVRDPFSDADLQSSGTFQGVRPGQGSFPQGMAQNSVDGTYVAGMSQYRNNTMGAGGDAFNNMATHPPTSGHPTGEPFPSGMRNNTMPGNDPYTSGRRDSVPVPDGFNRRTTNMPGAEPFPVNNRAAGMPMSQGNTGQFPYGPPYERERFDQQRPRVAASPSQPVQQGNTGIIPPYPNNSMDQNMYSSRFSQQHSSSRPATPSDSFGSTTLPNQQKNPHATGLPADQMRQQFPQKRPGEMYGPTSKRQDMMTPTSVISRADDAYRGIPPSFGQQGPYPQGAFPGDRPMTNQGGYSPGFREGRPPQGPAPAPQQGGKHELGGSGGGFMPEAYGIRDRSLPGAGPSPSWGSVQQRQPAPPYTNTSLGPHPFVSQAGPPRTLQQALMAAHRDRHPPSKMMKSSPPQIHTTSPQKKDIVFPPDSVEASQPALNKPKKKTSRDIGTIEAWKLMMALKSGLLAESTWALEVLNILLYDNNTIVYFDLGQLKGLLEILVDHYRASLIEVFGTLNDVEVRTRREVSVCGSRDFPQDCVCRSNPQSTMKCHDKSEEELIQEALNMFDVEKLRGADKKKLIRLEQNSDGFYSSEKNWDYHEGFKSNQLHWQCGGGDMTKHIVHVFESDGILKKILKRQARRRKAERARIVKMVNRAKRMEENHHLEAEENYQSNDSMENVEDCPKADDECIKEDQEEKNEGGEDGEDEEELEENTKEEEEDQETVYNGRNDTDDDTWLQSCSEELRAAKKSSDIIALYKGDLAHPTCSPLEDEGTCNDHTALVTTTDAQRSLTQQCITISNIIRSLSFIPGNDVELSKHAGVLVVMGRILLLHHRHAERKQLPQTYDREDHDDLDTDCPITDKDTWWWHCLNCLRENTLVTLTNISGQLDLSAFVERVSLPILDGLLHWAICLSACAVDPFPTLPATSPLTPKRIAVEALSKLSIQENNVDMILATPPFHRLEKLFATLTQYLSDRKEPVMREFAIVLLSSIAQGDPSASRAIASQNSCISFLLCYLEDSEYAKSLESGSNAKQLSQNPDIQPASPDMMRRTAILLAALAKVADNKPLFLQHQHRLLNLSMSPMVTDSVKALIADALYEIS